MLFNQEYIIQQVCTTLCQEKIFTYVFKSFFYQKMSLYYN